MSTLLLIRHGQASLRAADYDVLSELGVLQSQRLGEHLAERGRGFDRLLCGPLRRQRDTAEHLRAAAAARGLILPVPEVIPGLDEMPALELLSAHAPAHAARDPELSALLSALQAATAADRPTYLRAFEPYFQAVLQRWIAGVFDHHGVESYARFRARVEESLEAALYRAGRGARIAVVTSAGPIGLALRRAFDLSPWDGMRATFVAANTSITELQHRPGELTLTLFNALPHLHDPAHITLR